MGLLLRCEGAIVSQVEVLMLERLKNEEVQCYGRIVMLQLPEECGRWCVHEALLQWNDRLLLAADVYELVK